MVLVSDLVDRAELGVRAVLLPAPSAAVTWVVATELLQPASYLEGGELVLTTGLVMADTEAGTWRQYVASLVEAGVAALGLGTGIAFDAVPDDLREAARVDGASEWQLYKSIIFPQLTPIALSAVIIIGHMSLKSFDLIMSITDQRTYSTKVPAIDMFNFMTDNDYSNAAAVGTILLVLVAVAVIPYLIHDAKGRR